MPASLLLDRTAHRWNMVRAGLGGQGRPSQSGIALLPGGIIPTMGGRTRPSDRYQVATGPPHHGPMLVRSAEGRREQVHDHTFHGRLIRPSAVDSLDPHAPWIEAPID